MHWEHETVLVTGATGFVGGNLAARLVNLGANVISVERDRKPCDTLSALRVRDNLTTVSGDITDLALMRRIFADYDVTYAFHLAAQALVGTALHEPISTFDTNIRGTWTTLEAARLAPALRGIVVASSDKAYGSHTTLPYDEEFALLAKYPYDASKACADMLAQTYHATYRLPVAITRNANTYGPGDLNFSRLIPSAIRCALANKPLQLRSDGSMRRDYLYVDDAVDAYLAVAEAVGCGEAAGEVFNFGTGVSKSVLEVCETVCSLAGSTATPDILNLATQEIPEQYLRSSKAQARLGWTANTSLEIGLHRSIAWYRKFLGAARARSFSSADAPS